MGVIPPAPGVPELVAGYRAHPLHTGERHWPQTNCYVDLWLELLHAAGHDPVACLGFAATQDWEGDQFTFAKFPAEDVEALYGLATQELSIYDALETHVLTQVGRGRIVLVEVDGYHLPDTRGLTYRTGHGKTTIGVRALDPAARTMAYFHNSGLHALGGEDYDGVFAVSDTMPPYAEFVAERGPPLRGAALVEASLARLRTHLGRRPRSSPVAAWRAAFPAELAALFARPQAFFHQYAFNLPRQLGMNWELMGSHAAWLQAAGAGDLAAVVAACDRLAAEAKVLQFRMARLVSRRRPDPCTESFDVLETAYGEIIGGLISRFA